MSQLQIEFDVCVVCGKPSHEPKDKHVDFRTGYVEGSGQVCLDCYKRGSSEGRELFTFPKYIVEQTPNDADLGRKVRTEYWQQKEKMDSYKKQFEGKKIFESPDGGKTVYERPFGSNPSERKLVENK